jgi:alpha-galactosidase
MKPLERIEIAYIGGGSTQWAFLLMRDLALQAGMDGELRLHDIDAARAQRNVGLAPRIFGHKDARSRWTARLAPRLEEALDGAHFVVLSIEPGPMTMRFADLEIPRRHGIVQPVGDTSGPGGLCRAWRAVPTYAAFARAIGRHCPDAWVVNFTNPMTFCTAALYAAEPRIKALGCCHEVFNTQEMLADLAARRLGVPRPPRPAIELDIAGLNHFTFATRAHWQGHDLLALLREETAQPGYFDDRTAQAADRVRREAWFESDKLVAAEFLRRFGALGAAGDRHLVEFVPWFAPTEEALARWGVVCTPYRYRLWHANERQPAVPAADEPLQPSGEEGVLILRALAGHETCVTNCNLPNRGQCADLPAGHVVESYACFSRDQARPLVCGRLPPALAEAERRAAATQSLGLAAALAQDPDQGLQALLSDPLVRLTTDRCRRMWDEMLAWIAAG